jgi:hypothetical protein
VPQALGLLDVADLDPLVAVAEVRPHLRAEVADDQREPVARAGRRALDDLGEGVLEEGAEAHRVHALLQVAAEPPQAGAGAGGEADQVHAGEASTPAARVHVTVASHGDPGRMEAGGAP